MRYQFRLDSMVTADALGRVLRRRFGIPQWRIYVGRLEDRPTTAGQPAVAVTPPEGEDSFRWILVARDGSYGPVIVDEDAATEGDLRIDHAESPIAGEPDVPVIPPQAH